MNDDKKIIRQLIFKMLWILDDFDRHLRVIRQTEPLSEAQLLNLEHTRQQLKDALVDAGVKFDGEVGLPYDPRMHEVIERRQDDSYPDDTIIEVFEIGCIWDGVRIRMSKVAINDNQTVNANSQVDHE